jgi:hypothetical protein
MWRAPPQDQHQVSYVPPSVAGVFFMDFPLLVAYDIDERKSTTVKHSIVIVGLPNPAPKLRVDVGQALGDK